MTPDKELERAAREYASGTKGFQIEVDPVEKRSFIAGAQFERQRILDFLESPTMNGDCHNNWWEQNSHAGEHYAKAIRDKFERGTFDQEYPEHHVDCCSYSCEGTCLNETKESE